MHKTGATRYQKFLKSEKAKTKLKGKKELPKGTNVTKTNFKVKKIIIKEQLKKHGQTEFLSSKKLNAKELISRLSHFNTNARMEALAGLKELITTHSNCIEENLGQFIHGVTPLVLNIEKTVRRESIKVVHLVLTNVVSEKLDPFFDVLSTYLRSALTHIDNRIQEDSLLFLDVLLLCTPRLIALDFHKIIPNFLDMISKVKIDSKQERTLTVNLSRQITTVKWRIKVFHRLQQFICKFAQYNDIYITEHEANETTYIFNPKSNNNFSLYNPVYTSVCTLSCFSSKNVHNNLVSDEAEKFRSYVKTLMPLLFDIWLEACPSIKADKKIETVITEDAAILLKYILEIISLVWKVTEHYDQKYPRGMLKKTFVHDYRDSFSQHFVSSFPFVTIIRSGSNKNIDLPFDDGITNPKLITENLKICYFYIIINRNIDIKKHKTEILSVLNYLRKHMFYQSQNESEIGFKILHKIFSNEISVWNKSVNVVESLLKKIIETYFDENISSSLRQQIFTVLCKIAINENLVSFHASDAYKSWLKILPDILIEESITNDTVDILHKFAASNNKVFNEIIKPKLTSVIQNLPKLIISDFKGDRSYYKLFSILYWINTWDEKSFNLLEQQIMNSEYRSDYGNYILGILKSKSGHI
ncbi:testis-expressed protein 10 [Battus philenor]|uniref:testis-expressed protein 10 n=1 Tax=Battus philenor TaxID=42288 RepID=UPI0035CED478